MFRICYDIAGRGTVKPRLHYAVNRINTVVQRFCDGLYRYDTVWAAKRIYFTPAEQLSVIMMSRKRQLVVKLMEEDLLLTAA